MSTQTQARLEEARAQYHLLLTGQAVFVTVDQNGERMEFTRANREALAEYIRELEVQTGAAVLKSRRPVGFVMG